MKTTTRTNLYFSSWLLISISSSAAFSHMAFGQNRALQSATSNRCCGIEMISQGKQMRNKFQLSLQKDGKHQCNNSAEDDNFNCDGESFKQGVEDEIDPLRRNVIALPAIMATILADLQRQIPANAEENILEMDQNKIVMQMNSNNLPKKYASAAKDLQVSVESNSNDANGGQSDSDLTEAEWRRINVFEKAAPSVVYIDTFVEQRDAFSTNILEVPLGTGSGFVWDERGHIVTNFHVVRQAKTAQIAVLSKVFDDADENGLSIKATNDSSINALSSPATSRRNDGGVVNFSRKVYKARVIGVDPGKDIAVLKIDAPVSDLYPIDVGTSKGLRTGQSAFAIGNPFGLDHSMTVGIISGVGREVKSPTGRPITNVIQTDAAINPGNSGGPLLNSSGKLIGINTSIYSPSGASAGIGFAIPIDTVKLIVDTLIRDGKVVRPILGISYLESKQARALGIEKGVLVLDVPTTSAAFKAGMRGTNRTESGLIDLGDIIIKIEDMKISTEADLFSALEAFKPGDVVKVVVNRPDLETPNSKALTLTPTVLSIQLRASTAIMMSQFMDQQQPN
uniref:PDZ domain-containing protein n=2 Tax=Chaetoceros debilis TaxID=122233 RepID=A0A7S3V7C7_9STRA|mmetsp:Transcript_5000/g.7384  ORF Transcript_5000/g.7384 Transcript_5000/m.7384 type:complete len:566 (-) Transcript_5000:796-2493(-)|eukprot:CAMPEP_0194106436 /NCGR_PEP_ID=MMETSP0150-20130528/6438_1 /TAXON_ID=122233 /ORGANISM="Chaetoceros debilis, Strain MM31A-1" /LENGTH=565 /DNA_ID=CAMNT_0038794567 /DNA_START=88 /DNA_END=1785 /DNA_ORIENTATION=+